MAITVPLNPPTSQLPPIAKIKSTSIQDIANAIGHLRLLYNPEVRGAGRIDQKVVFKAGRIDTDSSETLSLNESAHRRNGRRMSMGDSELSLAALRVDEFERSYAIRWLTSLVSQADMLLGITPNTIPTRDVQPMGTDGLFGSGSSEEDDLAWESIIQDAAALLAICAGTASAGKVSRVFAFRHKTGCEAIKVQVTDIPLENQDYATVGAQTWGSACLLAEMIVDSPAKFGLDLDRSIRQQDGPLRVLELGAGTGLVSLAVAGLLKGSVESRPGSDRACVVATDFHPSILQNLQDNIILNTASWSETSPVSLTAHYLDWSKLPLPASPTPFDQPFDVIFGADVIYEIEHAKWLRSSVERFLRKPTLYDDTAVESMSCFHLIIPLRPTHVAESQSVEEVFPFASDSPPGGSPLLAIVVKEVTLCEVGDGLRSRFGGGNLVEYLHYTITWV